MKTFLFITGLVEQTCDGFIRKKYLNDGHRWSFLFDRFRFMYRKHNQTVERGYHITFAFLFRNSYFWTHQGLNSIGIFMF